MKSKCSNLRPHFCCFLLYLLNHVVEVALVLLTKCFEQFVYLDFGVYFYLETQGFKVLLFLLFFEKSVII